MVLGSVLLQVASLNLGRVDDDDETISNSRVKHPGCDAADWKSHKAELITSGCGGDTTHCNAATAQTDALLGEGGGGDAAHWKSDCAEIITSGCGGDMTHCYVAFTETDALLGDRRGGDAAQWKNDCAEVIASGCGGDMAHCYVAFTETDALLGDRGGDVAHWKNDCAEVIASGCGGDMAHCYAAFTETDALLGERGGGDAAHWKDECAEVITGGCGGEMAAFTETDTLLGKRRGGDAARWKNDCAEVITGGYGGDMAHCYAALTETDALLGERGGGDVAHCENDCAEVITSGCGRRMTHCTVTDTLLGNHGGVHAAQWTIDSDGVRGGGEGDLAPCCAALADADRLTGACGGRDPAQWGNSTAENIAHSVHNSANFLEANHSTGKPVSSGGHGPAHSLPNSKTLAYWNSGIPIEGSRDDWIRTVLAVMEHFIRHDSGMTCPEIKNSDSMGNAEEVCSAECVAAELIGALERFLERSEVCLKRSLPTDCRASALSSHAQTPGSVAVG